MEVAAMSVYSFQVESKKDASAIAYRVTKSLLPFASRSDKIIIKANICAPSSPEDGVTTHHEIIIGVLEALKHCKILIVESNTSSSDFDRNIIGWNPTFLEDYPQVNLVNLSELPKSHYEIKGRRRSYSTGFADILQDFDILINLPVLKTHILTGVSLGMKNLFGLLSEKNKSKYHIDIHDIVFGLTKRFLPHLTILDGIQGMEGMGPLFGTPANARTIIASRDVVCLDAVGAVVIGIDPHSVPYLDMALRYFGINPSGIDVSGPVNTVSFFRHPTLSRQVFNAFVTNDAISLESLKMLISAPDQTKNNFPIYLNSLETRKIIKKTKEKYCLTDEGRFEFLELYPECRDIL
jgi:uncharacterized protein (DUF362 family)